MCSFLAVMGWGRCVEQQLTSLVSFDEEKYSEGCIQSIDAPHGTLYCHSALT